MTRISRFEPTSQACSNCGTGGELGFGLMTAVEVEVGCVLAVGREEPPTMSYVNDIPHLMPCRTPCSLASTT
jgi:hypothetical protein